MNPQTVTLPPTYQTMIEEMGKQLKLRKSLLFKRVLLITWPVLLLIIVGYVSDSFFDMRNLEPEQQMWAIFGFTVYIVCSVIYGAIVGFIFEIEKQIWIDSYFDQKNLDSDTSWRMAKKLFWPGFKFRLHIAWKFYIMPIGGVILALALIIVAAFQFSPDLNIQSNILMYSLGAFCLILLGSVLYVYYIKVKLRYAWFIFLDTFGDSRTFAVLMEEMKSLNDISKSDTFKKSLVANLGTDSVKSLAHVAIGTLSFAMASIGGSAGKMLGNLTQAYGNELNRQATDLGNITAQYILYRFARKELDGKEQVVNEELYKL